jgi:protein-tyrosine phosphatase
MSHGLALLFIGGAQIVLGVLTGGIGWLLVWSGMSFALVGAAYLVRKPSLFGKRPDGSLAWQNVMLLLPFLLFTWAVWRVQTAFSREPACHEVLPGVWIGRRPSARDIPAGVCLVVDMTAEFPAAAFVRNGREYVAVPVLDGCAPDEGALRRVVRTVRTCHGPVYLHCALGHGRSGTVAAAVALAKGLAEDAVSAEELVRSVRAGIRLHPAQRMLLAGIAKQGPPYDL